MSMLIGYDAWLTTNVEYEKRQEQADYCDDNHDWDGEGYDCPECVMEQERWAEGPDPDDINDRRREQQEEEQN